MQVNESSSSKKDYHEPLYNIVCTVAGTGILQLAFTLKQSGWIQLLILLLCAAMANYTGKLIITCLYVDDHVTASEAENDVSDKQSMSSSALLLQSNRIRRDNYMAIGEAAYGQFGRYLVHFFQKMELAGVCCLFLILCGKFFYEGLSSESQDYVPLDTRGWILVSGGLVCVPLLVFHDMKEVAALSMFGMGATIIVVLVVVSYSIYNISTDTNTHGGQHLITWENIPITFAGTVVSFGGQPVYPSIEKTLENPANWPGVLNFAYMILLCMYLPTAILGYASYGDETYSPILCNLPHSGPITIVLKLLIGFHVLCAYPILMNVLCGEAEEALLLKDKSDQIQVGAQRWWVSNLIRLFMIGASVGVAYFVPFFADFMSFIGGVAVSFNTYVLPVCFYLKLKKTTTKEKLIAVFILIAAIAAGVLGGLLALKELIHKLIDNADPTDG